LDEAVGIDITANLLQFFLSKFVIIEGDIFSQRSGKDEHILLHDADIVSDILYRILVQGFSVQ